MKKLLLFASATFSLCCLAQNSKINSKYLKAYPPSNSTANEFESVKQSQKQNLRFTTPTKSQSICNPKVFTYGPNAYGTGGIVSTVKQNSLTYNSDLNAVMWTQRASPLWGFSGYTSGAIQTTWLDVATNVWDSMIIYRDSSNSHGARYPSGIFFNPSGNTNYANATVVGVGPVISGGMWGGTWYSNRQITGNYHSVGSFLDSNKVCAYGAQPFGNLSSSASGTTFFLNSDLQQVSTTIYVGGVLVDVSATVVNPVEGGTIGKAIGLVWSHDTIVPGFYFDSNTGYANDAEGVRLAFSPNGQIGYAFFVGRLATTFGNNADSTLSPIVFKSTNGGVSWSATSILQGYDWSVGHPEMKMNVGKLPGYQTANQFRPYLNHGIDLTVDSLGTLHIVGTVTQPYLGFGAIKSVDSLTYSYTYNWDYTNHHPVIWDMMTDGTTWNTLLVDSIITSYMGSDPAVDSTAPYNLWATASGTFLGYGARIQVSRSVTGGKIFYSWADSDSLLTGTLFNTNPDIHVKSYDISNQMVTPSINATQGLGECYFHYMSNISYYDNTQGGWVCPLVYTTAYSMTNPYIGADTVNYNYFNCAVFYGSQYTDSASLYRDMGGIGIANHSSQINSIVQNYPNPFSQTTNIVVNLKQAKSVDLKVYDVLGDLIYSKNKNGTVGENTFVFDGSALQAGVYYYTVTADGERATKKMILQK